MLRPGGPAVQPGGPMLRSRDPAVQPGGPAILFPRARSPRRPARSANSLASLNWGGYAASRRGVRFRYIQASFFVPYMDCAETPDAQSAHWVGLDGLNDATVEQAGISADCRGTRPVYTAWYELVPHGPVFQHMNLAPGDSIVASVRFSKRTSTFTMSLTDTTNGRHFSHSATCPAGAACHRSAAEAISEPPLGVRGYVPLANFQALDYTGIRVTDQSGQRGGLRSRWWNTSELTTVGRKGAALDQPTSLHGGSAFTVYWLRER